MQCQGQATSGRISSARGRRFDRRLRGRHGGHRHRRAPAHAAKTGGPSVKRFNLNGYVINADYSLGRNTGNTFQQTYKSKTVHGVPIAGPNVGVKFPVEDYVAMPIGNHEIYVDVARHRRPRRSSTCSS